MFWRYCLLFSCCISVIHAGFLSDAYKSIKKATFCNARECCEDVYIKNGIPDFNGVFGQHLAVKSLRRALAAFYTNKSQRPLVLSLHGTPGTGKNYMTDQIIEARYVNGKQSKYMHGYSGRINFPVDKDADKYANQLVEDIHQAISDCPHQTFVFDEVDKMPAGVFEAVVSLLDHNPMWSKIDFSKAIFIFLSNLAGVEIANKLSILMRKEGLTREDTELHHFERIIETKAYNTEGAFWKSRAIEKAVIDYFIPVLPLEQRHVKLCLQRYVSKFSSSKHPKVIEKILKTVPFEEDTNMFATSGCKKLEARVAAEMHTEL